MKEEHRSGSSRALNNWFSLSQGPQPRVSASGGLWLQAAARALDCTRRTAQRAGSSLVQHWWRSMSACASCHQLQSLTTSSSGSPTSTSTRRLCERCGHTPATALTWSALYVSQQVAGCVVQADGHTIVAASTAEKAVREGLDKTADVRVCRPGWHKLCLGALVELFRGQVGVEAAGWILRIHTYRLQAGWAKSWHSVRPLLI